MLSLLSPIYGKVIDWRNRLYDRGILDTFSLGARTISIGNITTGGTGKTPLVAHAAELLAERGEKVCILTRGYGRRDPKRRVLVSDGKKVLADAATSGDEPLELAQKLLGKAIVIADADRVAAAEWALRKFGITVFILDDGFQHRRARRDLDVICLDAMDPFGGDRLLPAGRLREPAENLARADAVVITRSDLAGGLGTLMQQVSHLAPDASVFVARKEITNLAVIGNGRAFAFCGLGNPEAFFDQLRRAGIDLSGSRRYPDHHYYTQADVDSIELEAESAGAEHLLTTGKDTVKFEGLRFTLPRRTVEIEVRLDDDEAFAAML